MRVAINIPYFLPYLRYYQVIAAVDCHVCEVESQFNRAGYAHRHKLPLGLLPSWIHVPVKSAPHTTPTKDIQMAGWHWTERFFRSIEITYHRAPNYAEVRLFLEHLLSEPTQSLAELCLRSTREVCALLRIETQIVDSREISVDKHLRGLARAFAICKAMNASVFVNREEGRHLYHAEAFRKQGMGLRFFRSQPLTREEASGYDSTWGVIDFLMRVPPEKRTAFVSMFDLIT